MRMIPGYHFFLQAGETDGIRKDAGRKFRQICFFQGPRRKPWKKTGGTG
jgi:hypothetical protein